MGKYDSIFNSEEISTETLSPDEAVAAIAVVAALADSEMSDVDADYLASLLWETEFFDDYSDEDLTEMLDGLLDMADDEGLGVLFNTAYESLSDNLVLDAFAAGVMTLMDDSGVIHSEQKSFLSELQQALELEDEEVQQVIDEIVAAFNEIAEEDDEDYDEEEEVEA
ncbi:MAG TPA: hypothetical protein V6C95_05605 [Coleofasciculaceae cyanobacterium]